MPGVDRVAEDVAPAGLLQETLDAAIAVDDDDAELERVRHRLERERGDGPLLGVELDQSRQVDVGKHVARDDEEAVVEFVPGVENRAGRAERRLLGGVDEVDTQLGAVAEVGADGARQKADGDDDLLETVLAEQAHDVLGHGGVRHREHRLWQVRRERPQPRALTARHDHGLHVLTASCRAGTELRSLRARRASGT